MTTYAIEQNGHYMVRLTDLTRSKTAIERLLAAGLIREMADADRASIRERKHICHTGGGQYGSGEYLLRNNRLVYVIPDEFDAADVKDAIKVMHERERNEHRQDVLNRVLGTYGSE